MSNILKCEIINSINQIYTIKFPDGRIDSYHKNIGRNLFVGKKSFGCGIADLFYYSKETGTSIDLEPAIVNVREDQYTDVLIRGCKEKTELLHKIVAFSWCNKPNIEFYLEVDHIDRNKLNNKPENLQYLPPLVNSFKEIMNNNPNGKSYFEKKLANIKTQEELKFNLEAMAKYWAENKLK